MLKAGPPPPPHPARVWTSASARTVPAGCGSVDQGGGAVVESTDRTSVMIVFLRSIANTETLSQLQQKLIIACHDDSSRFSEESNRRTASAFSASLSGSVAIITNAEANPAGGAESGVPLPVFTAGSDCRFRPLLASGFKPDPMTAFRAVGPTEGPPSAAVAIT